MTEEVKTCASCKHFEGPQNMYTAHMHPMPGANEPQCKHPAAATRDLIYGTAYARAERASKKGCGQQGKLWESQKTENKG